MKSVKLLLALLTVLTTISGNAIAQDSNVIYQDGNVSIIQLQDGWQVKHFSNIVAHGDGVLEIKNLPPAFQDFLDVYAKRPQAATPRKPASKNATPTYGPLLRTQWNQSSPYNDLCPESGGTRTVTGCTTIASAQLMYYYGYCRPFDISGTNNTWLADIKSDYITNVYQKNGNILYDYELSYKPDFSLIYKNTAELSKFVACVAFAQKAFFGKYSTSTTTNDQLSALQNNFGYKCETQEIASLSDQSLIENAVKKGMPVLISGNDSNGNGHSFIIDGCNGTEFHINYGWGGNSDGWFADTQYPNNNTITIAHPDIENFVTMQSAPKLLHITGNGVSKTIDMTPSGDGAMSYVQSEDIELESGEYEFCYEYADRTTIAPYISGTTNLEEGLATYGCFVSTPAKIKLDKKYQIEFTHNVCKAEVKARCTDLQVAISGMAADAESGLPIAGAIITDSDTKPTSEALQKNENEPGIFCIFSSITQDFVPTKPFITMVDICIVKYGNPKELTVSIQNGKGDILWQKTLPGDNLGTKEWESIEPERPLQVNTGETYQLTLTDPYSSEDAYFRYVKDENWNMRYRIWSSDQKYIKTDKDGLYSIDIDKHSSGTLYAYCDKYAIEPIKWDNIQKPTPDQNFQALATKITISGKVIGKDGKPAPNATVSFSETKPEVSMETQSGENLYTWYNSYYFNDGFKYSAPFQLQKKYIDAIEFCVGAHGSPKDLKVAIFNQKKDIIWQRTFTYEEMSSPDYWHKIVIDDMLEVVPGEDYYIAYYTTETDNDNLYMYFINRDNDNILYRIWTSDDKIAHPDADGNYSMKVDRHSSGKLYAFNDMTIFEPLQWDNIQAPAQNQDFNGISTEVKVSGKVLDKNSKPVSGAYISTSDSAPVITLTKENEVDPWSCYKYIHQQQHLTKTFAAEHEYLSAIDMCIIYCGQPGSSVKAAILSPNHDTICQTELLIQNIKNYEWTNITFGELIKLQKGKTYTISLSTDFPFDENNHYGAPYNKENNEIGCHLWTYDAPVAISDQDGNYCIKTERNATATLHAFYDDKQFNDITIADIADDVQDKDFVGDFATPVSDLSHNQSTNIYSFGKTIVVENGGGEIRIADLSGRTVKTVKTDSQRTEIQMQNPGIYIVKTGLKAQKVIVE